MRGAVLPLPSANHSVVLNVIYGNLKQHLLFYIFGVLKKQTGTKGCEASYSDFIVFIPVAQTDVTTALHEAVQYLGKGNVEKSWVTLEVKVVWRP
jgi:hypothetical protein